MRYPIYILSKGRSDVCLTARFLAKEKTDFRLVVEPQEFDLYAEKFGKERILVLPFSNLGLGGIPARNWIKEHANKAGAFRHWILDDNIRGILRRFKGRKINCNADIAFTVCEDFVDRFENVAIAGLNYEFFAPRGQRMPPFYLNVHVYSCILLRSDLPFAWRGRYNEDTDLCLQALSKNWCTILFNAFLAKKITSMVMKGGNTAELYQGDGRLKMARSLQRMWPGVVTTTRRFRRPQHQIKNAWRDFDTQLILKKGLQIEPGTNEYGMRLCQKKEIKSKFLQEALKDSLLG